MKCGAVGECTTNKVVDCTSSIKQQLRTVSANKNH
jgi:hypothetical protein